MPTNGDDKKGVAIIAARALPPMNAIAIAIAKAAKMEYLNFR